MLVTGQLQIVKKLQNSTMGNPKYLCSLVDENGDYHSFETKTNAMLGYAITNYEGKTVMIDLQYYYNKLSINAINLLTDSIQSV